VSLPYILTVASLICILIVGLAGITKSSKDIALFKVDTQNFTISASSLISLVGRGSGDVSELTRLATAGSSTTSSSASASSAAAELSALSGTNLTAADLGLADYYTATLWSYCSTTGSNTICSKAKFNWAAEATNTTAVTQLASSAGTSISLPSSLTSALKTFSVAVEWAEILYIIAAVATVIELFFGLFALCSRVGSCFTFIVSGISTVAILAASILATVMSSIVVGSLDKEGKPYGVGAHLETSFLAVTWIAAAFSVASGMFWLLSICCCSSGSRSQGNKRRSKGGDVLNTPYVGYERVHDPFQPADYESGQQSGVKHMGYGGPMSQIKGSRQSPEAYEPYSHHV